MSRPDIAMKEGMTMAEVTIEGATVSTNGELPKVGDQLPAFTLADAELKDVTLDDFAGKRIVLNIFPSVDTPTCQAQLRTFNKKASSLDNTVVIGVSVDLPFAQERFCGAEGLDDVHTFSAFRSTFGKDYGVVLSDGEFAGLFARAVLVADETGKVVHSQLVPSVDDEPDYEAALAAL